MGIEDSTLEKMTTNLLQVSSVFFIQQNELQAMHQRLSKELTRLVAIQNALSEAAQQHQDAVLQCISNFESLSVHQHDENEERPPARASVSSAPPTSAFDGPNMMASWREPHEEKPKPAAPSAAKHTSPGKGAGASSQSAPPNKKLLLPPVSSALRTFEPQKEPKKEGADEEDEDEGIKYVDKLVLVGGVLGLGLKANGEYVGTPTFQWFRRKIVRGQRLFLPIEGALIATADLPCLHASAHHSAFGSVAHRRCVDGRVRAERRRREHGAPSRVHAAVRRRQTRHRH